MNQFSTDLAIVQQILELYQTQPQTAIIHESMPLNNTSPWIPVVAPLSIIPAFITHLNYLKCVNRLSSGLSVSTVDPTDVLNFLSPLAEKKKVLANLTKNNLDSELAQIRNLMDYAQICISWIPVKSYYLFFNLIIVLIYLQTGEVNWLTAGHIDVQRKLKELIRNGEITFSAASFNTIYSSNRIVSWAIPSGNNVTTVNFNYDLLEKQVIRKMLFYSQEEYKRMRDISRLSGQKKQNFMNSTTINLSDFFYWYRIKANYRDMEFINSNVGTTDFYTFYTEYYALTVNFYDALTSEINKLSQLRFGRNIF